MWKRTFCGFVRLWLTWTINLTELDGFALFRGRLQLFLLIRGQAGALSKTSTCVCVCVPLLSLSLDLLVDVVDSGLKFLSSLFRRKMTAVCRTWALQNPHIIILYYIILYYTVTVMWFNARTWFHRQTGVTLTSLSDSCPIRGSMKETENWVWVHKYSCVQRDICIQVYMCDFIQTEQMDQLQVAWSCCELSPSDPEDWAHRQVKDEAGCESDHDRVLKSETLNSISGFLLPCAACLITSFTH